MVYKMLSLGNKRLIISSYTQSRSFGTFAKYAFMDSKDIKAVHNENKKPFVEFENSSNPDFLKELKTHKSILNRSKNKRVPLSFKKTGEGETPSSVRRIRTRELQKEVLVSREKIIHPVGKMKLICQLIRRRTVDDALVQLRYSKKRHATELMLLIDEAVKKAYLDHDLEKEDLYVGSCYATTAGMKKGINYHAFGRSGKRKKRYCHVKLILRDLNNRPVSRYYLRGGLLEKGKDERQSPVRRITKLLAGLE